MMGFAISLAPVSETLERAHRALMDRRSTPEIERLDVTGYPAVVVEHAREQWAARATAEYASTAQFAQLVQRLCAANAPIGLIGAATRLITDECRHAELCAQVAARLGGHTSHEVEVDALLIYKAYESDPLLASVLMILAVCCFGETLSVPMLEAIALVSTEPVCGAVAQIIAADEHYHARFGWEALGVLMPLLSPEQRAVVQRALVGNFKHFEEICLGSQEMLERLAQTEVVIVASEERGPNLGTLTAVEYATIFYHTVEVEIIPQLERLGLDPVSAWQARYL